MKNKEKAIKDAYKAIEQGLSKDNKPKHTPGPWEIDRESAEGEETWIVSTSEDKAVCLIEVHKEDEQFTFNPANAALIAAAPEMLKTLEDIIEADISGGRDELHYQIINIIAKAKGE